MIVGEYHNITILIEVFKLLKFHYYFVISLKIYSYIKNLTF